MLSRVSSIVITQYRPVIEDNIDYFGPISTTYLSPLSLSLSVSVSVSVSVCLFLALYSIKQLVVTVTKQLRF